MKKFVFILMSFYLLPSCKVSQVNSFSSYEESEFTVKKEFEINVPEDYDTSNYAEVYFKKYFKIKGGKDYFYGFKDFKKIQELSKGKFISGKSYTVKIFTVPRNTSEKELRRFIKKQKAQTFGFEGLFLVFDQKRNDLYSEVDFLSLGPLPIENSEQDEFSPFLYKFKGYKSSKKISGYVSFRKIYANYPSMILLFFPKV